MAFTAAGYGPSETSSPIFNVPFSATSQENGVSIQNQAPSLSDSPMVAKERKERQPTRQRRKWGRAKVTSGRNLSTRQKPMRPVQKMSGTEEWVEARRHWAKTLQSRPKPKIEDEKRFGQRCGGLMNPFFEDHFCSTPSLTWDELVGREGAQEVLRDNSTSAEDLIKMGTALKPTSEAPQDISSHAGLLLEKSQKGTVIDFLYYD